MATYPFANAAVAQVFTDWPAPVRRKALAVRELIFETAAGLSSVGELEETLKWGEPAYLTPHSKSGSTIRLAWKKSEPAQFGIYFHCQTNLVDTFRTLFPNELRFDGNRALLFDEGQKLPKDVIRLCIGQALTYHLNKSA